MENIDKKAVTRQRLSKEYKEKSKENNRKNKRDKISYCIEKLEHVDILKLDNDIVKRMMTELKKLDNGNINRIDTIKIDFLMSIIN